MTVWEFRRKVREHRSLLLCACPLGAAIGEGLRTPLPSQAATVLGLHYGYALGIIGGFDDTTPRRTTLSPSAIFDQGERYGRRMRLVASRLRGGAP